MQMKNRLSGMAALCSILAILAGGCASSASSSALEQPPMTSHMKSAVGTPNELSPIAPAEARNVRKAGNCTFSGECTT